MTGAPCVSVLIRSMDRPSLARALASVAAQDYASLDVVVIAACGDAHRDLPARCGAHPLRLLRFGHALPRAEAANAALDAAGGEWLNLLDDDDEFLPGHIRTLVDAATAGDARLAHSQSEDCAADGRVLRVHGSAFRSWRQLDTGFFRLHCALFARSLVEQGARFDTRFDVLEDMDFFVQCAQYTRFAFVERITARYYADAGESGAGVGANRDPARLHAAIQRLRTKWSALEARLHASAEFRLEQALWLLTQGRSADAASLIDAVLAEQPHSTDALVAAALLAALRGDAAQARSLLARADSTPTLGDLAVQALRLHAWLAGA
jgi:hypothetical protein